MRSIRINKINMEVLIRLLILLGFTVFFYLIIQSGKALIYVHPRIVPYMKFGIAALVLISIFNFLDIFRKERRKPNLLPYLVFIVPLFLAFTFPAKSLDTNWTSVSNLNPVKNVNKGATSSNSSSFDSTLTLQGGMVVVEDSNFYKWVHELNYSTAKNINKYDGKKIQVVGCVLKSKQFKEHEFFTARFMMSCCAADLQPTGFMCRYERAQNLKENRWVKIIGTVNKVESNGYFNPVIDVESIEKVDRPENAYIFP